MREGYLSDKVTLFCGDCLEKLNDMPEGCIDSVACDPPYHLTSIVKRYSGESVARSNMHDKDRGDIKALQYKRLARGFMGKQWDGGEIAFSVELWQEVYRVLKPGAHLVAFSGTRTYHRMACAIEDAGFEIRDQIGWLFGTGFPKSHNVGDGWGTALKPAWEPIVLARKPLEAGLTVAQNVLKWGTGAINIDGCRVAVDLSVDDPRLGGNGSWHGEPGRNAVYGEYEGATVHSSTKGRWPANIIHDGSEEVVASFPDSNGQQGALKGGEDSGNDIYGKFGPKLACEPRSDGGSAARFFYTSKADSNDRIGSKHPTVKPLDLMQYLCRLVTPKGGTVLDMFAGTGTTGEAAFREGFKAVLIEREEEYQEDIRRRMRLVMAGPEERARESIKAKTKEQDIDLGPLFGGKD
jgi:site-specific DNA-methyltransferase (adenine-specific)